MGTFASWVQPVASILADDAEDIRTFIRAVSGSFWEGGSVVEGWTNRDVLAHMAGGNDQMVQSVLRSVIAGVIVEAHVLEPDTDAENAARVAERRSWPLPQVIDEYEGGAEELLDLLAQLREEQRDVPLGARSFTLGKLLRIVEHERHDRLHLRQLEASWSMRSDART